MSKPKTQPQTQQKSGLEQAKSAAPSGLMLSLNRLCGDHSEELRSALVDLFNTLDPILGRECPTRSCAFVKSDPSADVKVDSSGRSDLQLRADAIAEKMLETAAFVRQLNLDLDVSIWSGT